MNEEMLLSANALQCIALLNEAGYEAFLVGGSIRDFLLKRPIHDIDVTTNALPEETKEVFRDCPVIETGIAHGTVTVLFHGEPLEITTYRTDTSYSDHRHPDKVVFTTSLKEDCARRDFTINAMGYAPKTGICDFFGGQEDLKNRIIRTVGDPDRRFEEDALRILRGIRFMAQLSFTIEPETVKAIYAHKEELRYVSMERITTEFLKTLNAPGAHLAFRDYKPVFEVFFPELGEIPDSQWAVFCDRLSRAPSQVELRFALLLRELPSLPDNFYRRMKLSVQTEKTIRQYLDHEALPLSTIPEIRHILATLNIPFASFLDYRKVLDASLTTDILLQRYQGILERNDCVHLSQLAINGRDLKALGYEGPSIAKALHNALDAVIEEYCPNTKEALLAYLKTTK